MDDKMQMPKREFGQREHSKRGICWCGSPSCPGGLLTPGATYSSTRSAMMSDMIRAATDRAMREAFFTPWGGSIGIEFTSRDDADGPKTPASLIAARKPVEEFILEVDHTTAWDDVIGNDEARAALIQAIEEPKTHPELYAHYGMSPPKGVMLFGPPGCGKTMFAKAAAAAVGRVYGAKAEVLVINGPAIQSPYIGKTEETIRAIFKYAREYQAHHKHPLTVFFDEAEVLFPDRTGRTRRVMSWEESQVAQFLSEMDGLNAMGVFVILATNRPEAIDEALLRDGRCDRKIKVERPTKAAVEHIVRKALADSPSAVALDDLVMAATESFFNPHYVIQEGHMITARLKGAGDVQIRDNAINFCLEHIVSGAMAAGVARRAKSRAFARDRTSGERSGVTVQDVVDSVGEIFEENKGLEHAFAVREFIDATFAEAKQRAAK